MPGLDIPTITDREMFLGCPPRDWLEFALFSPHDAQWSALAMGIARHYMADLAAAMTSDYRRRAVRMLRCVLSSYVTTQDEREHVAGLILKAMCE